VQNPRRMAQEWQHLIFVRRRNPMKYAHLCGLKEVWEMGDHT
jgi:hypothetical protein